ncbi:caspase family protein [uncultured Roseobacter sp.]|uniref:caspase family protein n=1 Tax=uncultured Roseobacter sp. TaxID=114847 RepID=UPI0026036355|nr:caspase family protein [uncultured Roseobacter sp.]
MRIFIYLMGFVVMAATVLTASVAAAERRLALVVGNGAYQHSTPLANPVNDAEAMANKLESLGFETYVGFDLDKIGMERLLRDFARASRDSDVNMFFYAGHGMSVNGTNYLVPVDAVFEDETALDFEAVSVDFVTRQMSLSNAVNLVFLDACRDNPLSQTLSRSMGATRSAAVSSGLAEMKVQDNGKGMAIAFATSPGQVALDGDGLNSPFTTALLKHIDAENTDIAEVFSRVTGDVYQSTDQAQRPWINVSLTGPVVLNRVNRVEPAPVAQAAVDTNVAAAPSRSMLEEQKLLFDLARETGDVEDYKAYLESFPTGLYANNARRMIRRLQEAQGGGSTQIASARLPQPQPAANTRSAAINEVGPLQLPVTAALRGQITGEATEASINLDRTGRGNVQARLNATGNNVGTVDGLWGNNTRRGISNWQASNGLQPTGFLSIPQLELLVAQTEGRYTPYTHTATAPRATTKRRNSSSNNNNGVIGGALLGIAIGTILSK